MNILPKKRWHVRTKDNIARVRRDEALAAEEEKKKLLRIEIAEREARTEALRKRARQQYNSSSEDVIPLKTPTIDSNLNKHINLFYELEQNEIVSNRTNEDHEREKKLEKEKYEKQIGYLTYLGQDTNEITGTVSWYNKEREELHKETEEVSQKQKYLEDPLQDIRKYLGCDGIKKIREENSLKTVKTETEELDNEKVTKRQRNDSESEKHRKKHKKEKKKRKHKKKKKKKRTSSSESEESEAETIEKPSSVNIEALRAERLRREQRERQRAQELLNKINGVTVEKEEPQPEIVQKYSSQFNPHLAKQNFSNR